MALIKNLHLLTDDLDGNGLSGEDIDKMEHAALQHKRYSNITFKIVGVLPGKIIFKPVQGKNAGGNYFSIKRLIEITHETFDRFFPGKKILVQPVVFKESPANKVDATWINDRMLHLGVKLKDIASDTGIDYTQLSSLVSGSRPISQPMKALFWFYFESKSK